MPDRRIAEGDFVLTSSRRDFLRSLGVGTVAGAALRWPVAGIPAAGAAVPEGAMPPDRLSFWTVTRMLRPSARVAEGGSFLHWPVNRYPFRKYDEVTERNREFHQVKAEQVLSLAARQNTSPGRVRIRGTAGS